MLLIAKLRAEAEDTYGMKLADIGTATDRISGGFGRDDGASVRKVGSDRWKTRTRADDRRHTMEYGRRWRKPRRTTERSPRVYEILSLRPSQDGVMRTKRGYKTHKMIYKPGSNFMTGNRKQ